MSLTSSLGGRGGVSHCATPGYLLCPALPTFGPANGVCNYLALETIYGMLIVRIRSFSPSELIGLYAIYLKKLSRRRGEGRFTGTSSQRKTLCSQRPFDTPHHARCLNYKNITNS